jgi:hypothetical protein
MSTDRRTALPLFALPHHLGAYLVDAAQRQVLTLDVLRQRGNQFHAHRAAGQPPVLDYDYDEILDGRTFPEHPSNYVLLRIRPPEGVEVDPAKRPFVVIDPRAGHGPGIGGFKPSSEVGVALRAGHPVYLVGFRVAPVPGQTLDDVARTEAAFLDAVRARHPEAPKPCVIGNCQAGWAVAMLAAVEPQKLGPIVLNGAPLSYWAGQRGSASMRHLGSLAGGTWPASLMADLAGGTFDGALLVSNFESLNLANTLWSKLYALYAKVDAEAERFLGFERWWHGFFLLARDEIEFITGNLFVGNRLRSGSVELAGRAVDLMAIEAPVVVFASHGDDIAPPQQALNWILDLYPDDDVILKDEQVIVYAVHEDVGHLGIFVSGRIAEREHAAFVRAMEAIDRLPPGLYEMEITTTTEAGLGDVDGPGDVGYRLRFVERSLDDIRAMDDGRDDEAPFAALAAASETTGAAYRQFVRPWMQMMGSPAVGHLMREMMPLRAQHTWLSDRNPAMWPVKYVAEAARTARVSVERDNPFVRWERTVNDAIVQTLEAATELRDAWAEAWMQAVYGPLGLGLLVPPALAPEAPSREAVEARAEARFAQLQDEIDEGGFPKGFARLTLYLSRADHDVEPWTFDRLDEVAAEHPALKDLSTEELTQSMRDEYVLLQVMPDEALAALPALLPTPEARREALALARRVILDGHRPNQPEARALARLRDALDLPPEEAAAAAARTSGDGEPGARV